MYLYSVLDESDFVTGLRLLTRAQWPPTRRTQVRTTRAKWNAAVRLLKKYCWVGSTAVEARGARGAKVLPEACIGKITLRRDDHGRENDAVGHIS